MRAALIGAVDFNSTHFKHMSFDYVVAVDAGWNTCMREDIVPHLALGDFDSLGSVPQNIEVLRFPSVKNESDMELACQVACRKGAQELYLYGCFAQRLDHTLANIELLAGLTQQGISCVGIADECAILALAAGVANKSSQSATLSFAKCEPSRLSGSYAPYVSLFAWGGNACVSIWGLAYEVENFELTSTITRGLSNELRGEEARIDVYSGCVIVVFPLDALSFASF